MVANEARTRVLMNNCLLKPDTKLRRYVPTASSARACSSFVPKEKADSVKLAVRKARIA